MLREMLSLIAICLCAFNFYSAHAQEGERRVIDGDYSVPVPKGVADLGTFSINSAAVMTVDGRTVIEYSLPLDLVGNEVVAFVLKQQGEGEGEGEGEGGDNFVLFADGDRAKARCLHPKGKWICLIDYPELKTDMDRVRQFLKQKHSDESRYKKAVRVAKIFSNEPAGILQLRVSE